MSRHRLRAQFRCDGSDEYLRWADALFDLNKDEELYPNDDGPTPAALDIESADWPSAESITGSATSARGGLASKAREAVPVYRAVASSENAVGSLQSPATFDLDILGSPHDVLAWVQERNRAEPNSARLTAGWCWPWSDPLPDRSLVNDILIGDFAFPWELKNGKRGRPGVPEAKHWAVDPAGADQAGTVYSVQGFEFRYVGVIMGPDLVSRDGKWIANPRANYRNVLRAKPPAVASIYLRRIYRTLLTRPLRGVRIFSVDAETREFLRSRVDRAEA
jgi:hypothetical protein